MVRVIREEYGLNSPEVFEAMLKVPRHEFVSRIYRPIAYSDRPVSIGAGQTMSQPYTVAFMTHLLIGDKVQGIGEEIGNWRVLEIGTGSGYQAAVLSKLVKEVYSVELVSALVRKSLEVLKKLKFNNVFVKSGDGAKGWKEKSPFDAIMVTAGIEGKPPKALFDQLKAGGTLVVPVGLGYDKQMTRFRKLKKPHFAKTTRGKRGKEEMKKEEFGVFHFVPFVSDK